MLKTVDLFAGCGGLSLGFQNAGADMRAAFEFWPTAADCYERNFSHPIFRTDLSDTENAVKQIRPFAPDLIIGGPPCQDFSHAGKRVEANRAGLTGSFAEIVSKIKPRYFVMENVDRAEKSIAYAHAREKLKKAGYGLTELVLDASHCGVPQKRKRFFCIGVLGEPDDAVQKELLSGVTKEATTLRSYFGEQLDFEFYYRHPRNYSRRAIFSVDEPAPTMRGMNRPVPKGYPGHPNDACPLSQDVRALTTAERAMIQTFPLNYKWIGSKTDVEQMIGNAVPVKLAEYVAGALFRYIGNTVGSQIAADDFKSWLVGTKNYSEKSAKDILSRCKRAEKIVGHTGIPDAYYIFTLERQPDFQALSAPVKSQIKRAIALNEQYVREIKASI